MLKNFFFMFFLIFSGCAGLGQVERISDLSAEHLRQISNVQFYETDKNLDYQSLGKIKGISCKGSANSGDTSKEAALMQLKIKAIKIGANAILYPTCSHDASVDWSNNCWESWVCIGEAAIVND